MQDESVFRRGSVDGSAVFLSPVEIPQQGDAGGCGKPEATSASPALEISRNGSNSTEIGNCADDAHEDTH